MSLMVIRDTAVETTGLQWPSTRVRQRNAGQSPDVRKAAEQKAKDRKKKPCQQAYWTLFSGQFQPASERSR